MRHFLISVLLLSLVAGCSSIGPHRIDVQQGNALDQETVARLKPGLNRSQVRFLLGTPLVVDPFRADRWDYVYLYYKAGKLTEQKHITLFFEGDTLARIEGDLPAGQPQQPAPAVQPQPKAETPVSSSAVETKPILAPVASPSAPIPAATPQPAAVAPVAPSGVAPVVTVPSVATPVAAKTEVAARTEQPAATATSVVPPLPSPKNAPAYIDPHPPAELSLQPETDVAKIRPDVIPPFPGSSGAAASVDPVLKSLNAWANAWARRDYAAYFGAYDASFVPPGGGSRADWEKRKRQALDAAKSIDIKTDSPTVERADDGTATVTFKQFYHSGSYSDAVVKQLRMVERDGRWLIVEEKVLSNLRGEQP